MLRSLFKSLKTPEEAGRVEAADAPAVAAVDAEPAAESPPPIAPGTTLSLQSHALAAAMRGAVATVEAAQAGGTLEQALARTQQKLDADPDDLEALLTLGGLTVAQDPARALGYYRRAAALQPAAASLMYSVSQCLQRQLRIEEAAEVMRMAVAAEPETNAYRFSLALLLFLLGRYREGFFHFRARNNALEQMRAHPWLAALPAWGGEPLAGRRLVVWTDWGGLGDELLFARYITEVHRRYRPAALYVSCSAQNRRLFSRIEGVTEVLDGGVFTVDCHAALLDLPCILGTDLDSIPAPAPYLHPDPQDVARWRERLAPMRGLKVGLCWGSGFWGGGAQVAGARLYKSMALKHLAPLCGIEGVTLVSLQKGIALPELAALGLPVHDFDAELNDMGDTAALAANLDLVITVDTSVSHLAGALNRPTLVLLPYGSGSFWLMGIENSPWYPSVRLLRHARPGDWEGVAARAVELVRGFAARGAVDVFA